MAGITAVALAALYAGIRSHADRETGFWDQFQEFILLSLPSAFIVLLTAVVIYLLFLRRGISPIEDLREDILEAVRGGKVIQYFSTRNELLMAAATIIASEPSSRAKPNHLRLAALHDDERKKEHPARRNPAFVFFDELMQSCMKSSEWKVQHLYYITTKRRFDMIVRRIEEAGSAEGFEVRALSLGKSPPALSPLIIGENHLFLAADDPDYFRPHYGIHIQSKEAVVFAVRYFDQVWETEGHFNLRMSGVPDNQGELTRLREHLGIQADDTPPAT